MAAQDLVIRYLAYALMMAVVAAGVAGVLESEDDAGAIGAAGAVDVEYPTVTRQGLKPSLVVTVENRTGAPREPAVVLSGEYLEALQLQGVTPDPAEASGVGDGLIEYAFEPLSPGERLRASFSFSIDQQAPGARFESPVRVALGDERLLDADVTTVVLP